MRVFLLAAALGASLSAYDAAHLKKALEEKECIGCDLRGGESEQDRF
jgi:hypothetical protein